MKIIVFHIALQQTYRLQVNRIFYSDAHQVKMVKFETRRITLFDLLPGKSQCNKFKWRPLRSDQSSLMIVRVLKWK